MHNYICEAVRNIYSIAIKNEYHQCIGFGFELTLSIRLREVVTVLLFHRIISIILPPIICIINLFLCYASVASRFAVAGLRKLIQGQTQYFLTASHMQLCTGHLSSPNSRLYILQTEGKR